MFSLQLESESSLFSTCFVDSFQLVFKLPGLSSGSLLSSTLGDLLVKVPEWSPAGDGFTFPLELIYLCLPFPVLVISKIPLLSFTSLSWSVLFWWIFLQLWDFFLELHFIWDFYCFWDELRMCINRLAPFPLIVSSEISTISELRTSAHSININSI